MKAGNTFAVAAKSEGLIPYEVEGVSVFPVYGAEGIIRQSATAFVAKRAENFPNESQPFAQSPGLSDDGRHARIDFDGRREYTLQEMIDLVVKAKELLG